MSRHPPKLANRQDRRIRKQTGSVDHESAGWSECLELARHRFHSDRAYMNSYLLRSSLVAALGGLLFGFDTAVIAGTTHALTQMFGLSAAMLGVTVSMALWGTVLGSVFAGRPSDRYGRRGCLAALGLLYVASALGCALAWNWYALLSFRLIGGLAIGGSSVVGPMYIAEISPAVKRSRLTGLFQLNVVGGLLLA